MTVDFSKFDVAVAFDSLCTQIKTETLKSDEKITMCKRTLFSIDIINFF